ncbi:ComF family protein [Deinococcus metalli]|uniref:Amidophosphoribosyltransferase n=1 Tax=Deinococcus metalli TaxID=1141878 RepID=A0A7W8KD58_9DEIO|nr:ComF family protein [Deinococcus metalli]MBB5376030.1 ComF family protein [Deinococcus metalli]GHF41345.1 amidophosphoribosyltransferase [Deinococcus metalli]
MSDVYGALGGWLRRLLPQPCPGCGAQLGAERGLCRACRAGLRPHIESHSPLRAQAQPHLVTLGTYHGVRRRAVRALKFAGARDLAGVLGSALADGVPATWGVVAVVPVPLHASRQRQRGFNQAALLGRAMAARLGVPCVDALVRTRATGQQAKQHAAGRDAMHGAFRARPGALPAGPVVLVDDVLTSGSTMRACQQALLDVGAAEVYAAVVAR